MLQMCCFQCLLRQHSDAHCLALKALRYALWVQPDSCVKGFPEKSSTSKQG